MCFLAATAFFPKSLKPPGFIIKLNMSLLSLLMMGALLFAYFGNETLHHVDKSEVEAVEYLYAQKSKNVQSLERNAQGITKLSLFLSVTSDFPYRLNASYYLFDHATLISDEGVTSNILSNPENPDLSRLIEIMETYPDSYIVFSEGQVKRFFAKYNYPESVFRQIENAFKTSPHFQIFYQTPSVRIYRFVK
jgi:hypothetical protein